MLNIFANVGKYFLGFLHHIGNKCIFLYRATFGYSYSRIYWIETLRQCFEIGFFSLLTIAVTSLFTGAVLALHSYDGMIKIDSEAVVASIVVISITKELGPVISGLMIAGRVGAAIAAEIGSMKISDQLDALKVLSIDFNSYLFVPRIFATTIILPILTLASNILGIYGGYLIGVYQLNFSSQRYLYYMINACSMQNISIGLFKSMIFGYIIGVVSCFFGSHCKNGAEDVGIGVNNAITHSSMLILVSNYVITQLLFV